MPITKHTPGPWEVQWFNGGEIGSIVSEQDFDEIADIVMDNRDYEANANLLSAAPDLLESLIEIWPLFESCIGQGNGELEGDREAITRAQVAIAKALGKTR